MKMVTNRLVKQTGSTERPEQNLVSFPLARHLSLRAPSHLVVVVVVVLLTRPFLSLAGEKSSVRIKNNY